MTTGQAVFASFWRSRWAAYLVALLLTGFTLLARLTVGSRLEGPTMIVFTIPVILSAYWGGMGPGLLATLLSGLGAAYYILPPLYSFNVLSSTHRWQEAMLLLTGTVTSLICEALHRTHRRLKSNLVAIELTRDELKGSLKETKQAEEETRGLMNIIQQEKDRIASLLNSISDEVWFADTNKRFTLANPAARRELDLDPTERIGVEQLAERLEVSRPDGTLRPIEESPPLRALQGEIVRDTEEMIRDLVSGELRYRQVSSAPVRDASGTITGSVSVVRDITERKKTEAALRESADQFRTMANSIPQLAWMAHADGFIFWYNQRWHDYTGTTPDQMEGWGWQSVHDPDLLPKVLEKWRGVIATGQPFEMEFPLRGADGRFRMFLTRVQPLKDLQGRVVQWFGTNTDVDELKRMEDSLRETQARLNSTLAAGSIGTWTWDIVKDCLVADEFTAGMFSIETSAAAKGLPAQAYLQVVDEEDQPGVALALNQAIQSCGYYDIEYRVRRKDGGFRWVQARGRVESDAAGNASFFHGAVMDITERKAAEMASVRLAALVGSSDDAIIGQDLNGVITSWNRGAEKIFGYAASEMAGASMLRLIPANRQEEEEKILEKIRRGESMEHFETLRQTKAGRLINISVTASPIKDTTGKVIGVSKVARDITEREQAEEARRASEGRYRTLFENAPDGIVIADSESYYVDANMSICRMLGYTRDELIGLHASDIVVPSEVQHIAPALNEINANHDYHREWRFRRKDGSAFAAEVIATKMPDGNLMGMIRDISERKFAEERIHQLNADLERRVIERTKQLAAANRRLELTDRHKSEFLANMSHELRTPLNGIIGFSEFLVDEKPGQLNAKQKEYLNDILNSGRHLLQLINDVLDLSKVEAGKMELFPESFSLSKSMDEVCAVVSPLAKKKNVAIDKDISRAVENVTLDQQKFKQVLFNLLSNAVKFTDGGGRVEIMAAPYDAGRLLLQVRDTGIGIKPEDFDKLFIEFQQLDSGTDRRYEGTGLGLALTKKIVEFQKGSISVESMPGKGSTFTVVLPLAISAQNS